MLVVVLPSPALVGVIAVTMTTLPSGRDGQPIQNRQLHLAAVLPERLELLRQNAGFTDDVGDRASVVFRGRCRALISSVWSVVPSRTLRGHAARVLAAATFRAPLRTIRVPSTIALSLLKATSRGRWTHPQSGLMTSRSAGTTSSARRMRSATRAGGSISCVLTSMTPRPSVNGALNSLNSCEVLVAAAREFERQRVDLGLEDRREQIPVAAFERRLAVAVAVADVQRDVRVDAVDRRVDGFDGPGKIFGEAGVVRLVDLQFGRAGAREFLQLEIQHARRDRARTLPRSDSTGCGCASRACAGRRPTPSPGAR